jgi:hypothetical protein
MLTSLTVTAIMLLSSGSSGASLEVNVLDLEPVQVAQRNHREALKVLDTEYRKKIAAANNVYIEKLEEAKVAASKAVRIKEAVAIVDFIESLKRKQQLDTPTHLNLTARDALWERLANTSWKYFENGMIQFGEDGSAIQTTTKGKIKVAWVTLDANTLIIRDDAFFYRASFSQNTTRFKLYPIGRYKGQAVAYPWVGQELRK